MRSLSGASGKYAFAYSDGVKMGLTRYWQVALIRDVEDTETQFLETVMCNAGFNYRVLTCEEETLAWLKG